MYRSHSEEDLYACSFYDYLDAGAAVAVEWSENIEDFIEEPCIRVSIENLGGDERKITVTAVSYTQLRLPSVFSARAPPPEAASAPPGRDGWSRSLPAGR